MQIEKQSFSDLALPRRIPYRKYHNAIFGINGMQMPRKRHLHAAGPIRAADGTTA